jgi:hypothetical protein
MGKRETLDPRQVKFLTLYLDPSSPTFGNALQSGINAGFSHQYSESITAQMPAWLSENLGNTKMLSKAERNLDDMLDMSPEIEMTNKDGETYKRYSTEKLKVKADITKFVASTVGRNKYGAKDAGDTYVQNNFFGLDFLRKARERIATPV